MSAPVVIVGARPCPPRRTQWPRRQEVSCSVCGLIHECFLDLESPRPHGLDSYVGSKALPLDPMWRRALWASVLGHDGWLLLDTPERADYVCKDCVRDTLDHTSKVYRDAVDKRKEWTAIYVVDRTARRAA